MTTRAVETADLAALVALWNASAAFDPVTETLLQEKVWGDADFRPSACLVDPDFRAFGMGVDRPNGKGYVKFLLVHPEHRRRGLGTALLQQLEENLRSPILRVCESHPNYLVPGVDVRYTPALLMLEKRGYQKVAETFNLICDLNQTFDDLDRPGIRRAEPTDQPSVMAFLAEHFALWQPEVARMFANRPISLHLAQDGNELIGFSGYDGNNLGTGWFGPMGTHPQRRGAGVGGVLLRRCLADLKNQGLHSAIIPWVGPYGFYSHHCGARIDRVFWRYEKVR